MIGTKFKIFVNTAEMFKKPGHPHWNQALTVLRLAF
jgi:hypothetical protein